MLNLINRFLITKLSMHILPTQSDLSVLYYRINIVKENPLK